ncbi:TonB-dependent receptor domain-containing protein [Marinihelvus fidelis]|uniref:TonB-dependent receptor domain-containing protein n=1 Tax=Marinihelvus fidelis TaxID=2613842 RepID=UPI001784938E|nr:TonB-dependent receptor [Marinihelvus fidelis]
MNPTARLLITLSIASLPMIGVPGETGEDVLEFDPIVVIGHRYPLHLSEIAGQISVMDHDDIEEALVENLAQMFRYEPGAGTVSGDTRFGTDSINIRGIGGNRIAIELDGVPIRNGFAIGSYSSAGRALVDTDRIMRAELLYGPASVLYGSDALGGVLSMTTWDPQDRVSSSGKSFWAGARAGWQSADRGRVGSGSLAWVDGAHGVLVSATARRGHETESAAVSRDLLDPQSWSGEDFSARYTWHSSNGNQLRLGVEQFERDVETEVKSRLGYGRLSQVTRLTGDDEDRSTRALLDFDFSGGGFDSAVARVFMVSDLTRQHTDEERGNAEPPLQLERDFELQTDMWGAELTGFRTLQVGASTHRFGLGVEFLSTRVEELRDGLQQDLETGAISKTILGESLPVRDFPNSTTRELGVFLEDVITLPGGHWSLMPALRLERYDLEPHPDELYEQSFPDQQPVELDETAVTPRLGIRRGFEGGWSLYGQVSTGFRAPPVEDANIGFDLPLFRYRAIPNPDLVSETSISYELGLRQHDENRRFALTLFDSHFDDLIESRAFKGFDPASGYIEFQSRNIGKARIYGVDLRWDQGLGAWHPSLEDWTWRTAASWTRGDNRTDAQPLNAVSPPQLVSGLKWQPGGGRVDAELMVTWTDTVSRVDESAGPRFLPPSATVIDLLAGWRVTPLVSLRLGLFNLLDETWWRWGDVQNLEAGDPMIPLLAQPGRNVGLTLRVEG